ncbi:MAG: FAD-dependent oxidoreductase [Terriglobales bacterium]
MWGPEHQRRPLDGEFFDVAVIGGGINGVAIARECARTGRRTLLLEQHDFCSGTTSRSTRIIHGGLRYLEHGEIALVRESLRERERLRQRHPHLIRPLHFLLALPPGRRSALEVRFGLWLYRRLGNHALPTKGSAKDVSSLERLLDRGGTDVLRVFHYDDAQCEFPERLVAEWLNEAVAAGAEARNYTRVLRVETANGHVRGVLLRDSLDGMEYRVAARWVVNATGPWADQVVSESKISAERPMIGGVRGSHLVLPRFAGAPESAVYAEATDGRPIFLIPWNGQLLLGTTEISDSGDPGGTQPSGAEIEYLMASFRRLFPAARLRCDCIRYSFAGVRPLPYDPEKAPSAIRRRHLLREHGGDGAAGMISVIGGKLTTAAALGRQCARRMGIHVEEPLLHGFANEMAIGDTVDRCTLYLQQMGGLSPGQARAMVGWFGRSAGEIARLARSDRRMRLPLCDHSEHVVAEAVYALRNECAATLADVLLRRVPVAFGQCWTKHCTRQAAGRIADAIGWSEKKTGEQVEQFELEQSRFLIKPIVEKLSAA